MGFFKKIPISILIVFFAVGLIIIPTVIHYSSLSVKNILEQEVEDNLTGLAVAHSDHIKTFLEEKKHRVFDFSFDVSIRDDISEINEKGYSAELFDTISEHLVDHRITEESDFYEVFVLNKNGMLAGTTNREEDGGKDFSKDLIFLKGKKGIYVEDFSYDDEFGRKGMVIAAPIRELKHSDFYYNEEDKVIGVVVFRLSIDRLVELIKNIKDHGKINPLGVGESGDIYLVNKDSLMITPSRFLRGETKGALLQVVDTPNTRNCLNMDKGGEHEGHEKVISFLDYKGDEVFGAHEIIPEVGWCLLVEKNKEEAIDNYLQDFVRSQIIMFAVIILIAPVIVFFVKKYLGR